MKTKEAKNRAKEWLEKKAPEIDGLIGAVLGGSANVMNDDEPWLGGLPNPSGSARDSRDAGGTPSANSSGQ